MDRQNFVHTQRCPVLIEIHATGLFQILQYTVRFFTDSCNVPLLWYEYRKIIIHHDNFLNVSYQGKELEDYG
jgi:hypothetical protein